LRPLTVEASPAGLLLGLDQDCFAYLDLTPGEGWSARLAIGHLTDHGYVRGLVARGIYEVLLERPTWRIRWTSDSSTTTQETTGCARPGRRRVHRQRLNTRPS